MKKREDASWAMMQAAVQEYKKAGEVKITVSEQTFTLWLGASKSPDRRRRNTTIRRLVDYATTKGATEVTVCWWSGAILSKGRRRCSVLDSGSFDFVETNPYLKAMDAQQHLQETERIFRSQRVWQ